MSIFVEMLPFSNEKFPSFEQEESRVAIEADERQIYFEWNDRSTFNFMLRWNTLMNVIKFIYKRKQINFARICIYEASREKNLLASIELLSRH